MTKGLNFSFTSLVLLVLLNLCELHSQENCLFNHIGNPTIFDNGYYAILETGETNVLLKLNNWCVALQMVDECGELLEQKDIVCDSLAKDQSGGHKAVVDLGEGEFVCAYTAVLGNDAEIRLLKFNIEGELLWLQEYSVDDDTIVYAISESADGGFYLAGVARPSNQLGKSLLIKTDSEGNQEWHQLDENYNTSRAVGVNSLENGDVLLTGLAPIGEGVEARNRVQMLSSNGSIIWDRNYGTVDNGGCHVYEWNQDSLLFTGIEQDQHWLAWMDYEGNMLSSSFGQYYFALTHPIIDEDQNIMFAVRREYFGNKAYIEKYSKNFDLLWSNELVGGTTTTNYVRSVKSLDDGGYLVAGTINLGLAWLVKTDEFGLSCSEPNCDSTSVYVSSSHNDLLQSRNELTVYPNPAEDILFIDIPRSLDELHFQENLWCELYTNEGKQIQKVKLEDNSLNCSPLQAGIYFGVLKGAEQVYSFKFVKK